MRQKGKDLPLIMKKLFKILIWLAVFIVVFGVALSLALRILFPPQKLAYLVSEQLYNYLHRKVAIEKVVIKFGKGLNPISVLGLEVSNLKIYQSDNLSVFAAIGNFNLRPNFLPLLRGRFEIDSLSGKTDVNLKLPQQIEVKGSPEFVFRIDNPAQKVTGKIFAKEVEIGKNIFRNFSLPVEINDGVLSIANFQADGYQGKINGSCKANLEKNSYDLDIRVKDVELNDLISENTAYRDKILGKINFKLLANVEGQRLQTIKGGGDLEITQGKVTGLPFTQGLAKLLAKPEFTTLDCRMIKASFSINDGKISSRDFLLDSDKLQVTGKGWVGFDKQLNLKLILKLAKEYSRDGLVKYIADRQGRATVEIEVKGRLDEPEYKLVINQDLQKIINGRLQEKYKKIIQRLKN